MSNKYVPLEALEKWIKNGSLSADIFTWEEQKQEDGDYKWVKHYDDRCISVVREEELRNKIKDLAITFDDDGYSSELEKIPSHKDCILRGFYRDDYLEVIGRPSSIGGVETSCGSVIDMTPIAWRPLPSIPEVK